MSESNNADTNGAASEDQPAGRQIIVHAQYIKDLSFENPNAPEILIDPPQQPDVQIGVNVGAQGLNSPATSFRAQKCGMVMSATTETIFSHMSNARAPPVDVQIAA